VGNISAFHVLQAFPRAYTAMKSNDVDHVDVYIESLNLSMGAVCPRKGVGKRILHLADVSLLLSSTVFSSSRGGKFGELFEDKRRIRLS